MDYQNKGRILLISLMSINCTLHAQDAIQPSATHTIQATIEVSISQTAEDGRRTTPWSWSRIETPAFNNCTNEDKIFFKAFFNDVKLEKASQDINRILSSIQVEQLSTPAKIALRQTKQTLLALNLD